MHRLDSNKIIICNGVTLKALLDVIKEGDFSVSRQAVSVVSHLCKLPENKVKAVSAGLIPLLTDKIKAGGSSTLELRLCLRESKKFQEASELVSKKMENDVVAESNDLLKKTSPVKEINDVNWTKKVENSVKPSTKKKLMWKVFLILFFLFLLARRHT
ncbi:unnamed protein product [Microthlaspi erraticum]|uniref:U-box domain-containing protein n=1 Tax=Microthlaspi erraticum TaxID=1685480 RepID=A0A6D2JI85_9BRAS|nr:unnamed protein product [Microthlaspi erraticum]